VLEVNPKIYIETVTTGDGYLSDALAPTRFAMALLAAFAFVALVLSAVGLYGVVSYTVSQRTREIGIRIALGARPSAVTGLVVGGGLRLAVGGVLIGVGAAAASTRVLSSLLYGVSPFDPLTFVGIGVLIAAVALLASCVPARRASRIDPSDALRAE
jgi:putative ABC transport system permease protein